MMKDFDYRSVRNEKHSADLNMPAIDLAVSGNVDGRREYVYGRYSNNSCMALAEKIASLYGVPYETQGAYNGDYVCQILSSGMACVTHLFYMLGSNDKTAVDGCILADDLYYEILSYGKHIKGWNAKVVNPYDTDAVLGVVDDTTRFVMLDSSAIPFTAELDIKRLADAIHRRKRDCLVIVDNTSLTPYYCNPFELGADIVFDSCTKYINGFGDAVLGSMVMPSFLRCEDLYPSYNAIGMSVSPLHCYLVNRGLMTLSMRMDRITATGRLIAGWFKENTPIDVRYPGRSGIISFIFGDNYKMANDFIDSLKIIGRGYSFGMNVSVIDTVPDRRFINERRSFYIRLSIGLEEAELLLDDLRQAWDKVKDKYPHIKKDGFVWYEGLV